MATPSGQKLKGLDPLITRKPVWVRQDEHFHVDFAPAATDLSARPGKTNASPSQGFAPSPSKGA